MSRKLLLAANPASRTMPAQGVDLDGALDYFSRSSDLTGNVDSKTFTFSCTIYPAQSATQYIYDSGTYFQISLDASNQLVILGKNAANTTILNATVTTYLNPLFTFHNLQMSIDLANSANRSVYINDLVCTVTWTTYTNDTINFTNATHSIGATSAGASKFKGRLQSVFLDYTYRDLSIEANRRLFIDANGKPADGWKTLSPIIGMSMKDDATAHINDYGTGGNFTPNGTFATSNRGANQDNCVASRFDGVADWMNHNTISGAATTVATISGTFRLRASGSDGVIWFLGGNTTYQFHVRYVDADSSLYIYGRNSSAIQIFLVKYPIVKNKQYHFTLSIDISDTNKRHLEINGTIVSPTWTTYNTAETLRSFTTSYIGATATPSIYFNGDIGELYYSPTYTNISTSNPFWDSTEGKPIPVRKVISNTGVTPLVAMPLDASNAGKNYGTGGDFTANSAPYVGARGASEHLERTSLYNGTTGYLTSTGLTSIADTKTITLVGHIYKNASTLYHIVGSTNSNVSISINASDQLVITAKNTAGTTILSATVTTAIANTTWTSLLLSIDLSNTSNRSVYLNGVSASVTWTTYTNDTIDFTNASWVVGADVAFGNKFAGTMSLMMDNTYIDFSSEVNRLKYIDGLGYPLDINAQVTKGVLTKPVLYLASRDTTNLGLNSGYGGNLTVNGTIVAGADVLG